MKYLFFLFLLLATNSSQAQKTKKPLPDSVQIKNTIIGFYKWYNANWEKVIVFKLYKGKKEKDGPPYMIDWKEVERYFAYLRKNVPYLSAAFIEYERKLYKQSEEDFKKYPEDELPWGFDYDHFTNSQEEPSYLLEELNKKTNKWTITIEGAKAFVNIQTKDAESLLAYNQFFCGEMKKEKGKWKIARLDCDTTIDEPLQKEPQ